MSKKFENNLDQAFFDQFEQVSEEELQQVNGGVGGFIDNSGQFVPVFMVGGSYLYLYEQ